MEDKIYKDFLKDVLNRIKAHVNLKDYDVSFTGGGSLLLKDIISGIPCVEVYENAIYSNVIGAEEVCRKMWR